MVVGADGELRSLQAVEPPAGGALCIFEFFYLARPDSRLSDVEVHGARIRMGERLAAEAPADADLVLPIPDSGTPAAVGFARASGIPFSDGLIKNRYVGRTFIQPDQGLRQLGVHLKFNPVAEIAGKRIVIVDDSIVRGNTTRQLVAMLFDAGAAEVHVRVSSPPIVGQCFYGIDLADPEELVASSRTVEEVRELIGATSLAYLSLEGLQAATRRPEGSALPRLPHRRVPDRGAGRVREAPLRGRARLSRIGSTTPGVESDKATDCYFGRFQAASRSRSERTGGIAACPVQGHSASRPSRHVMSALRARVLAGAPAPSGARAQATRLTSGHSYRDARAPRPKGGSSAREATPQVLESATQA